MVVQGRLKRCEVAADHLHHLCVGRQDTTIGNLGEAIGILDKGGWGYVRARCGLGSLESVKDEVFDVFPRCTRQFQRYVRHFRHCACTTPHCTFGGR